MFKKLRASTEHLRLHHAYIEKEIDRVETNLRNIEPFSEVWIPLYPEEQTTGPRRHYDEIGWDHLADSRQLVYRDGLSICSSKAGAIPLREAPAEIRVAALLRLSALVEVLTQAEDEASRRADQAIAEGRKYAGDRRIS